ncbi:MAG: hypothetical protein U5K38_15965 [Woeseiaceae bacterium]|nr:hypothetical protein [Woeseiaceae bacterium]
MTSWAFFLGINYIGATDNDESFGRSTVVDHDEVDIDLKGRVHDVP